MTAETSAYTVLSGAAPVTAIVSTKIYPDNVPELISPPALVIERSDTEMINTIHGGIPVAEKVLLDIWCMASSRLAADSLAGVVKSAIVNGLFYVVGKRTVYLPDPEPDGLWSTVITVMFWE